MRLIQSMPGPVTRTFQVPGPSLRRYPRKMFGAIFTYTGRWAIGSLRRAFAVSSAWARGFFAGNLGVSLLVSRTGEQSSIKCDQALAAYDMSHQRVIASCSKFDQAPSSLHLP